MGLLARIKAAFGIGPRTPKKLPASPPSPTARRVARAYQRSVIHPAYDLDPERINAAYCAAENGDPRLQVALWDDLLERDGDSRNLYEQRANAIAGVPWSVIPGGPTKRDARAAALLQEAMAHVPHFQASVTHLLGCNRYGYAASEIEWAYDRARRRVVPRRFVDVHPDEFRIVTSSDELLFRTLDNPAGEELRPGSWWVTARAGTLPLARKGLARVTGINSAIKVFVVKNWVAYTLRYGIPFLIAKLDAYTDQTSRAVAEEILATFGDDGGAVAPLNLELEAIDGARRDAALHEHILAWVDRENAKAVNGVTLANDTGSGSSSYALGTLHGRVRWENIQADAGLIDDAFVQSVSMPFVAWNGLNAAPPRLDFLTVPALSPAEMAQVVDLAINRAGLPVSAQQLRERLGLRAPADDKDRLPGATSSSTPPPASEGAPS